MATEKRLIDVNALQEHIGGCYGHPAVDILDEIATFPTVDAVEVVHGRFVDAECSVCRWFGNIVETRHYNYCPNCGAKMDGERRTNERKAD